MNTRKQMARMKKSWTEQVLPDIGLDPEVPPLTRTSLAIDIIQSRPSDPAPLNSGDKDAQLQEPAQHRSRKKGRPRDSKIASKRVLQYDSEVLV